MTSAITVDTQPIISADNILVLPAARAFVERQLIAVHGVLVEMVFAEEGEFVFSQRHPAVSAREVLVRLVGLLIDGAPSAAYDSSAAVA